MTAIEQVCSIQVDPLEFFGLLTWLDGRPLLDVMEPYRQKILSEALSKIAPMDRLSIDGS